MSRRRVVVTGVGLITPVGIGAEPSWQSLVAQLTVAAVAIGGFYFNARTSRVSAPATQ